MSESESRLAGHVSFVLNDADGNPHQYDLMPHPADLGAPIVYELMAMGAKPLGELVQAMAKAGELATMIGEVAKAGADKAKAEGKDAGDGAVEAVMDLEWEKILTAIDFAKLGQAVEDVLASGKAPGLVRKILENTRRDDQPLDKDVMFGSAYQQNYGEMLEAAWKSVAVNRFFPLSGILSGVAKK